MTTSAELVDRFMEHKEILSGMGIMADHAAHAIDNAVDIGHGIVFVKQLFFVIVTGKTKLEGAFGPEIVPVITSMGIMAQGASSDQCSMAMFACLPVFFAGMTDDTGLIDSALAETDPPGLNVLLVTSKALLIDGGAVRPFFLVNDVFVAVGTGGLCRKSNQGDGFRLLQVVAIDAAFGQLVVLVEKVETFQIQGQEALQRLIREFQLLAVRDDGKDIRSLLEGQPEVQVIMRLTFHDHNRFKHCTRLILPYPGCRARPRLAQDKMGFRIPGNHLGSRRGCQQFHICSPNEVPGCRDFQAEEKKTAAVPRRSGLLSAESLYSF